MMSKFFLGAILGLFAIGSLSVFYRIHRSKPLMKAPFGDTQFSESWCSGRSDRSLLAQQAIAKNILWVVVTKRELHVSPHFPFNLMFLPEAFGWDHRIPSSSILDIREMFSPLRGRLIAIKYRHATGDEENLELWVEDTVGLLTALAGLASSGKIQAPK